MPQLNPTPWLMILLFSWMVFLTFVPPKILAHTLPNESVSQDSKTDLAHSWNWPWY
uniref:ATP synthase F0 subunit 8 n=1 Tax=Zenopsis conchifer TaxID=245696 RepID=UPI002873EF77|nr:ATP synthase F0 subunit 8 [Zenopsis conchifer]WMI35278.1 ATP synthase F0 subunit 8 [Zenopsis conchifer]